MEWSTIVRRIGKLHRPVFPRNFGLITGVCTIIVLAVSGLLLPLPYSPIRPYPAATLQPPSSAHWFGTDPLGFDIFARTLAAGALDLPLVLLGVGTSLVFGVPLGLLASGRGRGAELLMRALDTLQAFPLLVLAIVVVGFTGSDIRNVVVAIVLITTPQFIRLIRSEALALQRAAFVDAARVVGVSRSRLILRHLLPNVSSTVFAQLSLGAAHALMVVAALTFLGIGVSPPQPSWGAMIRAGAEGMTGGQWWVALFPGLAIFASVLAFNAVADRLSDISERIRR